MSNTGNIEVIHIKRNLWICSNSNSMTCNDTGKTKSHLPTLSTILSLSPKATTCTNMDMNCRRTVLQLYVSNLPAKASWSRVMLQISQRSLLPIWSIVINTASSWPETQLSIEKLDKFWWPQSAALPLLAPASPHSAMMARVLLG